MKRLAQILMIGFAVFMALAVAQQWRVFFPPQRPARDAPAAPQVPPEAVQAIRQLIALEQHVYASGGDRRFVERLPASPEVTGELMADVAYLQHNGRVQQGRLMRFDVLESRSLAADRVEVLTREYWVVETLHLADRSESDPTRSLIFYGRYLVKHEGARWLVTAWDQAEGPDPDEPAADGEG